MSRSGEKRRRSLIDELFEGLRLEEIESLFKEFSESSSVSGYSISVFQTPEGTRVRVKAGKDVDVSALRRQLERQYPGAKIEIEGGRQEPLIREISARQVDGESPQ